MARPSRWDEVVACAARNFRQYGFAQASLEGIADELGMWKGSLYNYISTKEDLLVAVVKIPADRLLEEVQHIAASEQTAEAKLKAVVQCHVDVLVDIYDFAAVYLHEVSGRNLDAEWRAIDRKYVNLVIGIIREGVDEGAFHKDTNDRVAAMTLLGALNWLTRWWDPQGTLSPTILAEHVSNIVINGLAASPPRAASASRRSGTKRSTKRS